MQDFIHSQGPAFFTHLLRRLSDEFGRGATEWLPEAGITSPPRTASTLIALEDRESLSVTELADLLRQSHPLVITWVRQLTALGFVRSTKDATDGRRTVLSLTPTGREEVVRYRRAFKILERAYADLLAECDADVAEALWRVEQALRRESFADRLQRAAN